MAHASLVAISGPKKSNFQGPPLTMALVIDMPASKSLPYVLEFISCLSPIQSGKGTFCPSYFFGTFLRTLKSVIKTEFVN
jgi:hypothetical protein